MILWLRVVKNYGFAKIRVFLGRIFGISLASGSEETWCFQNLCLSGSDKFHSVGELSCQGCELEIEWQIAYPSVTGKVRNLQKSEFILVNLGQFWCASSTHCLNQNVFCVLGAGQKVHFYLVCYVKFGDVRIPSLSQEKRKIAGVLWHNFGIFTHTKVRVFFFFFFFFFFLNKVIYKNKSQLAHTGACTKLKENTIHSVQFSNLTISTFWSMYKAEIENLTVHKFVNLTRSTFQSMYKAER